jgi:predicted nucleotidyltransferase component of viral defense system
MENSIDLKEEIERLSAKTNFSPLLLEKDYHLTRVLHELSNRNIVNLVFKGGTCLNKCYLGFYRLSEDLDFVYNQDVKEFTRSQAKNKLDELRRIIFEVLEKLGLETNKKLGEGWKMLTSEETPKIVGLEIKASYKSALDDSLQNIKIEISFRKKLFNPTKFRPIHHEFINGLGEPFLPEDVLIESIDLVENFAEKFRALVTRRNIAARDLYDISFIIKRNKVQTDKELINLAISKINESIPNFNYSDFLEFIENLAEKSRTINIKEIESVLRSEEKIDPDKLVKLIQSKLLKTLKD